MTSRALEPDAHLLREIRDELRALRGEVAALSRRQPADELLLLPFLQAVYAFALSGAWSAGELLADARQSPRQDVHAVLAAIVGDRGDPAKRLGRWLERHDGAAVGGYRLQRVKREAGSWLYAVTQE